jgi:hypothetical protein
MLRISQCYVVLKGRNFHNRRSSTCGYESYVLSGRRDIDRCVT